MMYAENIACAVKVNGKILRENKDKVMIPFGSEYSILFKNMNSVRTQFTVQIDGEDAVGKIICEANSSVELERFLKNGNLHTGNKFKFIERTAHVEAHRGVGVEDGLVRIESWKEVVRPAFRYDQFFIPSIPSYPCDRRRRRTDRWPYTERRSLGNYTLNESRGPIIRSFGIQPSFNYSSSTPTCHNTQTTPTSASLNLNDVGITVEGGRSDQRFVEVNGFETESTSTVIVLHLIGQVGKTRVTRPVTVKTKTKCSTCGTVSKSSVQFCGKCGTSLTIYA